MEASKSLIKARKNRVKSLSYKGNDLEVLIIFSKRKTLALYVYRDSRIELRVPNRSTYREIDDFLSSKSEWILRKKAHFDSLPRPVIPAYTDGSGHAYLGRVHRLILVRHHARSVERISDSLLLKLPDPDNEDKVRVLLESWYREKALQAFPDRLVRCHQQISHLGVPLPHLKVRKMKARWGSCSRSAEICLNSLLIQQPEAAIDYVIVHELCHLLEFSHSKSFYQLLADVMPDWKDREQLLGERLEA
jgi:predicted metal-dependent hydrolase